MAGNIAVLSNGGGLAMATTDLISLQGGSASCFAEIEDASFNDQVQELAVLLS